MAGGGWGVCGKREGRGKLSSLISVLGWEYPNPPPKEIFRR